MERYRRSKITKSSQMNRKKKFETLKDDKRDTRSYCQAIPKRKSDLNNDLLNLILLFGFSNVSMYVSVVVNLKSLKI